MQGSGPEMRSDPALQTINIETGQYSLLCVPVAMALDQVAAAVVRVRIRL